MAISSVYGVLLLASIATSKIFRSLVSLGTLFALVSMIGIITAAGSHMATSGRGISFNSWDDWAAFALFILAVLSGCAFAHVATITALSPSHSNREKPLRLWFSGLLLVWAAVAFGFYLYKKDFDFVVAWAYIGLTTIALLLTFSASMAPGTSRRILMEASAHRWWRFLQFPFSSGAENGMVWAIGIGFFCIFLIQLAISFTNISSSGDLMEAWAATAYFLYLMAYICSARALWYFLLRDKLSHFFVGAIAGVLIALGSILPYVLVLGNVYAGNNVAWHFGNVVAVLDRSEFDEAPHLIYASVWAIVALFACSPSFMSAYKRFRPPQEASSLPTEKE
jgi:hypothetical protein